MIIHFKNILSSSIILLIFVGPLISANAQQLQPRSREVCIEKMAELGRDVLSGVKSSISATELVNLIEMAQLNISDPSQMDELLNGQVSMMITFPSRNSQYASGVYLLQDTQLILSSARNFNVSVSDNLTTTHVSNAGASLVLSGNLKDIVTLLSLFRTSESISGDKIRINLVGPEDLLKKLSYLPQPVLASFIPLSPHMARAIEAVKPQDNQEVSSLVRSGSFSIPLSGSVGQQSFGIFNMLVDQARVFLPMLATKYGALSFNALFPAARVFWKSEDSKYGVAIHMPFIENQKKEKVLDVIAQLLDTSVNELPGGLVQLLEWIEKKALGEKPDLTEIQTHPEIVGLTSNMFHGNWGTRRLRFAHDNQKIIIVFNSEGLPAYVYVPGRVSGNFRELSGSEPSFLEPEDPAWQGLIEPI